MKLFLAIQMRPRVVSQSYAPVGQCHTTALSIHVRILTRLTLYYIVVVKLNLNCIRFEKTSDQHIWHESETKELYTSRSEHIDKNVTRVQNNCCRNNCCKRLIFGSNKFVHHNWHKMSETVFS